MQDFAAALRDLEEYLRLAPKLAEAAEHDIIAEHESDGDAEDTGREVEMDDATQIWEHVKTLRRRLAMLN